MLTEVHVYVNTSLAAPFPLLHMEPMTATGNRNILQLSKISSNANLPQTDRMSLLEELSRISNQLNPPERDPKLKDEEIRAVFRCLNIKDCFILHVTGKIIDRLLNSADALDGFLSEQLENWLRLAIPSQSGTAPLARNQSSCILGIYHKQLKELRKSLSIYITPKKFSVKCFLDVAAVITNVHNTDSSSLLEGLQWLTEDTGDSGGIVTDWAILVLDMIKTRPLLSGETHDSDWLNRLDYIFSATDIVTQLAALLISSRAIVAVRKILEILYRIAGSYPQWGNIFDILHGIYPYCEYISKVPTLEAMLSETRCEFISDHAKECPVYDGECVKTTGLIAIKCLIEMKKLSEGMVQQEPLNDNCAFTPHEILTKFLELFNGVKQSDTLSAFMVRMFGDNDAGMIQVLLMLSEIEEQQTATAKRAFSDLVHRIDAPFTEILHRIVNSFSEHISVDYVFLYFLESLSFDVGVLLDYLISSEVGSSFLTFFVRWLKRAQADSSRLVRACARVKTTSIGTARTYVEQDDDEGTSLNRLLRLLKALAFKVEGLDRDGLFPYNPSPLVRRLKTVSSILNEYAEK